MREEAWGTTLAAAQHFPRIQDLKFSRQNLGKGTDFLER